MRTLDLNESFTARGSWFLPGDPSDAHPGEVQASSSGIRLRTDRAFKCLEGHILQFLARPEPFKTPVLFGTTVDGEKCTLRRVFASRIGQECEFVANELFLGAHLDNDPLIVLGSAARFSHLEEWAFRPLVKTSYDAPTDHQTISFPLDARDVLSVQLAPPLKSLIVRNSIHQVYLRGRVEIVSRCAVLLDFAEARTVRQAIDAVSSLAELFSLLVGETVAQKEITLRTAQVDAPIGVFLPLRFRKQEINYSHDMFVTLEALGEHCPELVKQWFGLEGRLKPVYNLLLSSFPGSNQYLQSTYLSLTQGIESFHRLASGGKYLPEIEYEPIVAVLNAAIPSGCSEDLRTKLKTTIKFGNDFSLRKRLKDLLSSLDEDLRLKILGRSSVPDYVSKIVDLRNYLTHYDDSSSPGIAKLAGDTVAMYNLNQRLRALLTVLLLMQLGLPKHLVQEFLNENKLPISR